MKILQTKNRKAVSPVIATLLLVAIAVIGGALIFAFAQGYFTSSQISGRPAIEQFEITGYDARDGTSILLHDGATTATTSNAGTGLLQDDVIAVYLENKSPQKLTLVELTFGGTVFAYTPSATINAMTNATFGVVSDLSAGSPSTTSASSAAEIAPGGSITVLLSMYENIKDGRDVQLKLKSGNGAVLVGTIVAGQQEG